jgi:hypothetical protein
MATTAWGLLGPESIASERRTRTLGLGATVRSFNDLAVPGMGGIRFAKQPFLAVLGVAVAQHARSGGARVSNIEVANAIEALACWLSLDANGWNSDPRVRGAMKMRDKTDLSFSTVRKSSFYVTQPMRQATIQPLISFGLVESEGERFNAFACSDFGRKFIEAVCEDFRPYNHSVIKHLVRWVGGRHSKVNRSPELAYAISPTEPMSQLGREFLRERIVSGNGFNASRRCKALVWVKSLDDRSQADIAWKSRPSMLDESHWKDLHAGALFFLARDAAIELLDQIESHIGNASERRLALTGPLPTKIVKRCKELRKQSQLFLELEYDPSPNQSARAFCRECTADEDVRMIENLLTREGRVLRQSGHNVVPGVAFGGKEMTKRDTARSDEEAGDETELADSIKLPDGISHRVSNLIWLNRDLNGKLEDWLGDE